MRAQKESQYFRKSAREGNRTHVMKEGGGKPLLVRPPWGTAAGGEKSRGRALKRGGKVSVVKTSLPGLCGREQGGHGACPEKDLRSRKGQDHTRSHNKDVAREEEPGATRSDYASYLTEEKASQRDYRRGRVGKRIGKEKAGKRKPTIKGKNFGKRREHAATGEDLCYGQPGKSISQRVTVPGGGGSQARGVSTIPQFEERDPKKQKRKNREGRRCIRKVFWSGKYIGSKLGGGPAGSVGGRITQGDPS